jgi:hypothetical protein
MELMSSNTERLAWRRWLPWLALLCILASFVIAVERVHPSNFFGLTQDDSIYFSSAKALAEGKGYVLESFPGTPAATKYPVFYPWILSWVWRWNPSFPANLRDAIAVTVAFGIMYVTAAFLFLRRLKALSEAEALILTAFCALHPLVIFYSGQLLADIPFAALALLAIVLAESALEREGGTGLPAFCGIVTGLATLTRLLGVPVAGGLAVAFAVRHAWRQLAVFCGCVAPFFGALAWRVIFSHAAVSPASGAAASSPGWIQTWAYYTNYLNVWKEGVPNASVFAAMLKNSVLLFLRAPAEYFVSRSSTESAFAVAVLIALVSLLIFKGVLTFSGERGSRSIYWVLSLYISTALLWNFPQATRFLIPFLPLFAAGLWVEGRNVLKMAYTALTGPAPATEKLVASTLGIVLVVFVCVVSVNYAGGMRNVASDRSRQRGILLPEKREAYDWLTRSTDPNARVVAYEDATLYLYSGREAIRPLTFSTAVSYEQWRLSSAVEHMTDVAQAISADYWLVSDDDYIFEWRDGHLAYEARMKELEEVLPLVYSSQSGHVRIYSLGCIQRPEDLSCESARRVLFPTAANNVVSRLFSRESKAWN